MGDQRICAAALVRMHHHTGRLIGKEDMAVLIDHTDAGV